MPTTLWLTWAEEKMREINEAYDMIQSMRVSRGNGGGNSSSAGYNSYNNSYNAGEFGDIRPAHQHQQDH